MIINENNKLLIIVPAYNEGPNISKLMQNIKNNLLSVDVLVINDASTDDTGIISEGLNVEVLNLPYNLGIGGAVQTGYKFALEMGYDVVLRMDGDGQHPPEEARKLAEPVLKGNVDIAIGSRYLKEGNYNPSLLRKTGTRIFSSVVSFMIRQKITDATSGFTALNRDAMKILCQEFPRDYPEVESLIILHRNNMKITEIPVKMKRRENGRSSIAGLKQAYYMIKVLLSLLLRVGEAKRRDEF